MSLAISQTPDGLILIHCFSGCGASDILSAIGLSLRDLYPDSDGRMDWRKEADRKRNYEREASDAFAREIRLTYENAVLKNKLKQLQGGG